MDHCITDLVKTAKKVGDTRDEALVGLLCFLEEMEKIGCGPAEQWERIQALQDEAFRKHLT